MPRRLCKQRATRCSDVQTQASYQPEISGNLFPPILFELALPFGQDGFDFDFDSYLCTRESSIRGGKHNESPLGIYRFRTRLEKLRGDLINGLVEKKEGVTMG